jgi:hypothetical protein
VAAAAATGRVLGPHVAVELLGGELLVSLDTDPVRGTTARLTGPAETVFEGRLRGAAIEVVSSWAAKAPGPADVAAIRQTPHPSDSDV